MDEREVLEVQLEELLAAGITDASDALELAAVAGMAHRLGASAEALAPAVAWREGVGRDLLDLIWPELDLEPLVDDIEGLADGNATAEAVEEALFEFDEVVAAAVWCGKGAVVRDACRQVAEFVRLVPDLFVDVAWLGAEVARLPTVARDLDVYDYWLAVADAG